MVCQAAGKSRFRALKHETGITGKATIIVRIIACFQPLQECQAEYFRQLLKPITIIVLKEQTRVEFIEVQSKHIMKQSAWQTGNKNYTTDNLTAKPPEYLPAYESRRLISANLGLNSFLFHGCPSEIGLTKKDEEIHTQQRSFIHLHNSPPTEEVAAHEQSIPQRKKFFIFDRSGAETRMMFGSLKPQITNPAAKTVSEYNSEQPCGVVNDSYEDHVIGEDSEYHEDTEELNALLYSDNDDISNDGVDEDEVSTGRSPLDLDNGFDNSEQREDSDDEVTSWARPLKRHKPLSFGSSSSSSIKLSSMATKPMGELSPQLCEDDKLSVRDKIRSKLSVLENLVPGSKGKDPLVILEETIQYLKYFKANNPLCVEEEPERRGRCGPCL